MHVYAVLQQSGSSELARDDQAENHIFKTKRTTNQANGGEGLFVAKGSQLNDAECYYQGTLVKHIIWARKDNHKTYGDESMDVLSPYFRVYDFQLSIAQRVVSNETRDFFDGNLEYLRCLPLLYWPLHK